MVDSYIYLSINFSKAYEYTVQLENRTSNYSVTSWISISEFFYFWGFERLVKVTE